MKIFEEAFQRKLIYVFEIPDATHRGLLKIGDTTIKNLPPTEKNLELAARDRIDSYTKTAGIEYNLKHVELAVTDDGQAFRDYAVHRVLKKYRHHFKNTRGREWFKVDLNTVKNAIKAVKRGRRKSKPEKFSNDDFRPEQIDAINQTVNYFKTGKEFLWNAKMRFGKTLCALKVAHMMKFSKTIIFTHRPVVNSGWQEDFDKIFQGTNYTFLGKDDDITGRKNFLYFISIQDLRGSEIVGGTFDKNVKIFDTDWDFVIIDEAHEGTTTERGDSVIKNIVKENSKVLKLSGTPFNILADFDADNVYTWDYVMEQRAKADWDKNNFGDPNPYADLPAMKIYTYNLAKTFNYVEGDIFSFRDFFETDGKNFIHKADVKNFLDMLTTAENYPYSRAEWQENFRHSLWIIPGVKEGKVLSKLLQRHKFFGGFEIVNVAGNGDSDDEPAGALEKVLDAINTHDRTITLSCGKLTAGVTVPEWTAVFYLAGSSSTSAANYLQTIFRVQSPCNKNGRIKQNCYVFDFAPDRTLKMIAKSAAISPKAGKTKSDDFQILDELLNFCPVIAMEGSRMNYRADNLLRELNSAWIERAVSKGFADNCLYSDEALKNLDKLDLEKFSKLQKIIGASNAQRKTGDIIINDQGLDGQSRPKKSKKPKQPLTPEQIELERLRRQRSNIISILRGISIRLPLLIYGSDIPFDDDFTLKKFTDIDDASWAEFMPKGVTKDFFCEFIKYYDRIIFIGAAEKIRKLTEDADKLTPLARVDKIAELFATFHNPDKETVLTPWRVVKLHIDSAFDENFFSQGRHILEINSKTGLYPLYVACKIYRTRLGNFSEDNFKPEFLNDIWDAIVDENIFVICKTPMAVKITRRTLAGLRNSNVNAKFFDDIINTLKNNPAHFVERVTDKNFWSKGVGTMKFDGVVGNPPYQIAVQGDNKNYSSPVYHLFLDTAFKIADKVSLIHPARCLSNGGDTPDEFNQRLLADKHFKVIRYYPKSQDLFPSSDIKGGIVISLRDVTKNFEPIETFFEFDELKSIHDKVVRDENFQPFSEIVHTPVAYRLSEKFFSERPDLIQKLQKSNDTALRTNIFERLQEILFDDKPNDGQDYIQILGRLENRRVYKWLRRDYVTDENLIDRVKIFLNEANGTGKFGEKLTPPFIVKAGVGCTQTFITVGAFDSEAEAQACISYIKSKFCRVMLGILKVTQHNPPATWAKVPLQDFTSAGDIDWHGDIDAQLYSKYKLSESEIKFIEEHVKAMD